MTVYSMNWVFGIGSAMLIVGIGLGMLIAYFLLPGTKQVKKLQKDLEDKTAEFAQYRERVTKHFSTTSDLFKDLTTRYRGLYDHLASGAQDLCTETLDTPRLDFSDVGLLPNRESWTTTALQLGAHGKDSEKPDMEEKESASEVRLRPTKHDAA
uniref:Z-ring associated protein G n=1 Tax=Candidatus Kentrum sp. TUN TaxID=2126343 RepID=A0A450Z8U3_9GAMM|nr:MAG: hypothetical protein BECKTUN1418E_GA0071001_100152 [Candidatus Kentron sp. TUN]VFK50794.1 MAG: hypothetical protein BECKTUN1418D_GA0071000_100211 [Candidatus Kentron sp. TUN]VFK51285.1 MAG: hypothetical protein BECKTUN1418F_GA0071002_100152 [Candidatus Kentron sp. TUN]